MEYDELNEIPAKKQCTLQEACEYLAFGRKPIAFRNIPDVKKALKEYHGVLPSGLNAYLLKPGDPRYDKPINKVIHVLCNMLKEGIISTMNFREQVIPSSSWKNLTPDDIIKDDVLYRSSIKIKFEQLKIVMPVKQYNVVFEENGRIYVTDGKTTLTICEVRPGYKKHEWLKFYFEHPNQTISEQDMFKHFKCSEYEFKKEFYDMNQYVFNAFQKHNHIMHQCFPILSTKKIHCTPKFIGTDALVF